MYWLDNLQAILNNREIATLLWLTLSILYVVIFIQTKEFLISLYNLLTKPAFIITCILIATFLSTIIYFLKKLDIWEASHLKDITIWLFTIGFSLVLKVTKIEESPHFFKEFILSLIKWSAITEFITGLYSFDLLTEIILLPIIIIVIFMQVANERYENSSKLDSILKVIIVTICISIITYSIYKTVINIEDVVTFKNLISFLLPNIISLLFIPLVYFFALYCAYENYFVHLNFMALNKEHEIRLVKRSIFKTANFNLEKLMRIKSNFNKKALYSDIDLAAYIQEISKKPYSKSQFESQFYKSENIGK